MIILSAVCATLTLLGAQARPSPSQPYPFSAFMDEKDKYQLNWEVKDKYITFELIVQTTGYVGLGWSAKGGMKDADIITAWVDNQGKGHIQDRFGVGFTKPTVDNVNDVFLVMAKEVDGYTIVKFLRKLDTCDKKHDRPITSNTMRVIWSFGNKDPATPDQLYYHSTNRGTKSMHLTGLKPMTNIPTPSDAVTHNITMDNFKVPSNDTFYACRLLELPRLAKKHHVVEHSAIITPGNEGVVHHMIAYQCEAGVDTSKLGISDSCKGMRRKCHKPSFGWAVGGKANTYPAHVGAPLGGPDLPRYVLLEMHYDNPMLRSDIIDSSGIQIVYTSQLRKYDLGVMSVGKMTNALHVVPPQQKSFQSFAYCSANCIDSGMKAGQVEELKVIGVFPHTHLAGRGIVTRHIRNGKELPFIQNDQNYDFNYQTTTYKEGPESVIRRGDELIVVCTYETMDRKKATFGGEGTRDEMCFSFLFYYPEIPMPNCVSQLTGTPLSDLFGKYRTDNPAYKNLTTEMFLNLWRNNMSWVNAAGDLQEMERESDYGGYCNKYHPLQKAIKVDTPYKPPPSPCDVVISGVNVITTSVVLLMSSVLFLFLSSML